MDDKSLLDSTHEMLKSPESAKSTSPESIPIQPAKKVSLKRNISVSVPIIQRKTSEDDKPLETSSTANTNEPEKKVIKISELTGKDRLELRNKKFNAGNGAAPQSERLQARAARFGIAASDKSSESSKPVTSSVSLEVLKKRAERFGTVLVPELKKSELDEKLQKRQERFGASTTKAAVTAPAASSDASDLEAKALKRLERFKQTA